MEKFADDPRVPPPYQLAHPLQSCSSIRREYLPSDLRKQVERFQQSLTGPASATEIYSSWQRLEDTLTAPQRLLLMVAWNQYMQYKDPEIISDAVNKLLREIEQ